MEMLLQKASIEDCEALHRIQVCAFAELLDKYRDYDTNPGAEPLSKTIDRMQQPHNDYYFIRLGDTTIGFIRVVRKHGTLRWISQMCILPRYQGNGYGQQAIKLAEALYPEARHWELDTIKQEKKLCHLYEKMGYRKTGRETILQEGMTLIDYAK